MALTELKNTTQNLPNEIEASINSQVEYYKLYLFKMMAKSATGLITIFIMGLVILTIVFFLSVALAFALGEWLGSVGLGFLIMAGLLSIFAIIVYIGRKKIIHKPLLERLSDIYFD